MEGTAAVGGEEEEFDLGAIVEKDREIAEAMAEVVARKRSLEYRVAAIRTRLGDSRNAVVAGAQQFEPLIYLDVGGTEFHTARTTLLKVPASRLEVMFSGRHQLERDDNNNYFIDRDGNLFRFVLDFLRDGVFKKPSDPTKLALLRSEFAYYGIQFDEEDMKNVDQSFPIRIPPSRPQSQSGSEIYSRVEGGGRDLFVLLDEKEQLLREIEEAFNGKYQVVESERVLVHEMNEQTKQIVLLNVGGTKLKTTRSVLCSCGPSMLSAMFASNSKHTLVKDRDGRIFLDRDGDRFQMVLNFLRNAAVKLPNPRMPAELREEFGKLCIDISNLYVPQWMDDRCGVAVLIDGIRAICTSTAEGWTTGAMAEFNGKSAKVKFVQQGKGSYPNSIMVGLAPKSTFKPDAPNSFLTCGYSLNFYNGALYGGGKSGRPFTDGIQPGSVVEVHYEPAVGNVSFSVDGDDKGVAFTGVHAPDLGLSIYFYSPDQIVALF